LLLTGLGVTAAGSLAYDGYTNDFQRFHSAHRFLKSMKIAAQISLDYSCSLAGVREDSSHYDRILHEVHLRSAEKLLQGCLENGGLYVKIGQCVSSINHILPKEYTDTLKKLEDRCLPRQMNEVKQVFMEDFGQTPDELFESFNYNPIAAASLAQVFKAQTKDGKTVAVKVQYRDLQKRFKTDIGTILFIQNLVAMVHKNYNFGWIIEDLKDSLEMELDFRNEVRNAEQCAKDLANLDFVHVPKVFHELSGLVSTENVN
jgi:aarF domain-containing kinase